jgi:oligopeptide transport system permease protein
VTNTGANRRPLSRTVTIACGILAMLTLAAVVGPEWITGRSPIAQNLDAPYARPLTNGYVLGSDSLGRDVLARLIGGLRLSLLATLAAVLINAVVGVGVGLLAGWLGGWTDRVIMAVIEALQSVPTVLVVILLAMVMEPGLPAIILAIGVTYWLDMARLVRAEVRARRHGPLVESARALGASTTRILFIHLLPAVVPTITVALAMLLPAAIFMEAFLGFVGLGVPPPAPSLGNLAAEGTAAMRSHPYLLLAPAAVLVTLILCVNLIADELRARSGLGD